MRPDSHVAGNAQAAVTVVEFADFECPYCGRAEQAAREARKKFGNEIRFVFRHLPLQSIHAQAEKAAEASECGAEQGKFWESVEKFYGRQNDLSQAALERYAAELGLDQSRFHQCLSSGRMAARVQEDVNDARALGVRATPTFFVGQRRVEGPLEFAQFSQLIEQELASRGATLAQSWTGNLHSPETHPAKARNSSHVSRRAPDPNSPASSLLGSSPGGLFAQFQTSAAGCSEGEARRQQAEQIRTREAHQLFESGPKVLFVDVRTAKEFAAGRIRRAINLAVDEIEQRWTNLPKDRTIVLYESGRSSGDVCASSRAAGRSLLAHGFARDQVKVYQDGLAGWEAARLPVEH